MESSSTNDIIQLDEQQDSEFLLDENQRRISDGLISRANSDNDADKSHYKSGKDASNNNIDTHNDGNFRRTISNSSDSSQDDTFSQQNVKNVVRSSSEGSFDADAVQSNNSSPRISIKTQPFDSDTGSVSESPRNSTKSLPSPSNKSARNGDCHNEITIRDVVQQFYFEYNPERVSTIDMILEKYVGNEIQLIKHLKEKYRIDRYEPFENYLASFNKDKTKRSNEEKGPIVVASTSPPPSGATGPTLMATLPDISGISSDIASRFMSWGSLSTTTAAKDSINVQATVSASAPTVSSKEFVSQKATDNPIIAAVIAPATNIGRRSSTSVIDNATVSSNKASDSDESIYLNRIRALETELKHSETERANLENSLKLIKSQNAALKSENIKIKSDLNEITSRMDSTSKNIIYSVERESTINRENQLLQDKVKQMESTKNGLEEKVDLLMKQRDNKHKQLVETIRLTHKLGAQLRFLAAKAYQHIDIEENTNSNTSSMSYDIMRKDVNKVPKDFCVDCVKYGILCDKLGMSSLVDLMTTPKDVHAQDISQDMEGNEDISNIDNIIVSVNESNESKDDKYNSSIQDPNILIRELRKMIKSIHSAYISGRTEVMITIQENTSLERRISEQQREIEDLNSKLIKLAHELNTASGSADSMKRQIVEAQNEAERYKAQLSQLTTRFKQSEENLVRSSDEIRGLREILNVTIAAKKDLAEVYSKYIKNSESDAMAYIKSLSERLLLEREDMLSKMSAVFEHDRDVRGIFQLEIQREMHRLREELFKSRRAEAQREREMAFLQTQLIDAVERISTLDGRVNELLEAKKELEELQIALTAAAASSVAAGSAIKAFNTWRLGNK